MYFTKEQLSEYQEKGFILLHEHFSRAEVSILKQELPTVFAEDSQRRVLEKEGQTVRSVYGSHKVNELFRRLTGHPRIVEPAIQFLESDVYVYQFKINAKAAFTGDIWAWHQDYIFWLKEDGMAESRVINVAILLDEAHEFNAPMFVIPGSHKENTVLVGARQEALAEVAPGGAYQAGPSWVSNLTANLKYSLSNNVVTELALKYGLASIKGPAGSVLFFDANLVHGSSNNISPFERAIIFITFNSVMNIPTGGPSIRPDYITSRDYAPIQPLSDNTLLQ